MLFGIDKVTKYHMDAPLYVTTFVLVMNKDKYNQMSDRQKKAIDDNCNTEAAGRVGEPWGKFEDAGVDKVKAEEGHEVYKLTRGADRAVEEGRPSRWSRPGPTPSRRPGPIRTRRWPSFAPRSPNTTR